MVDKEDRNCAFNVFGYEDSQVEAEPLPPRNHHGQQGCGNHGRGADKIMPMWCPGQGTGGRASGLSRHDMEAIERATERLSVVRWFTVAVYENGEGPTQEMAHAMDISVQLK